MFSDKLLRWSVVSHAFEEEIETNCLKGLPVAVHFYKNFDFPAKKFQTGPDWAPIC